MGLGNWDCKVTVAPTEGHPQQTGWRQQTRSHNYYSYLISQPRGLVCFRYCLSRFGLFKFSYMLHGIILKSDVTFSTNDDE